LGHHDQGASETDGAPAAEFDPGSSIPPTELSMVVHAGTHVDSPRHYFLDGSVFEEIPLDRLYGPGVVRHLPKKPDEVIQAAELERARPLVLPGDILAIDTGWSTRFGTVPPDIHCFTT